MSAGSVFMRSIALRVYMTIASKILTIKSSLEAVEIDASRYFMLGEVALTVRSVSDRRDLRLQSLEFRDLRLTGRKLRSKHVGLLRRLLVDDRDLLLQRIDLLIVRIGNARQQDISQIVGRHDRAGQERR